MATTFYGGRRIQGVAADTKPTNVQTQSRFEETDTQTIYYLVTDANSTFSDSFITNTNWTQAETQISVNTVNTRIDYQGQINGVNGGRLYHDMGTISDTEWIYRFPWNTTTATANSGNNQPTGFIGITSNLTTGATLPNDAIGIRWTSEPFEWQAVSFDNGTLTGTSLPYAPQVGQIYIEIKRNSGTSMTVTLFQNSDYTNSLGSITRTIPSTVTGLRYLMFAEYDGSGYVSGGGNYITQVNGALKLYNNVSSLPAWVAQQ